MPAPDPASAQRVRPLRWTGLRRVGRHAGSLFRSIADLTAREQRHLVTEFSQVKGLMPLLMKPRNRQRWTAEDRAQMAMHLRRLSRVSPYLVVLVMPGGLLALPALAWWLDRRRAGTRARPSEGE